MKTLILGAGGQLGRELQLSCPAGIDMVAATRGELDISRQEAVLAYVADCQPDVIINAAAYTAVDGAESKPDLALEINAEGPGYLALAAARCGARLLHVSTDFVFDGSATEPYDPRSETRPLGAYGHSKLAGECRVREILPTQSLVLRTAWVYSRFGQNFVNTMLRLMAERDRLRVVDDQVGAPTWAAGLAKVLWSLLEHPEASGIYHWTDAGRCSWYAFACEIQARALALGLLDSEIPIEPIPTSEYPTPAERPAFSVLDLGATEALLGRQSTSWQDQLQAMLEDLKAHPDEE
ncbi:MAG: dTDP-4-dehydrorhamnose reductase [Halieaceae bacterium]|nr:dTDP-4-dehydrorhamnose reductase [Halieaceae bacterium]